MKKFRAGIVGCGSIFPMHAYPVSALENVELAAICDTKEASAKEKAEEFKCAYYTDYKDMIENADIDVVHICAPHYLHAPIAIYAAGKKKHVLTEKPMAINYSDATDMIKAAKDNGVTLGVIFQNRYNAASRLIKETLDSGALGKVLSGKMSVTWKRTDEYYANSDWRGTLDKEGGGAIINQSIHTVDLMNYFINDEPAFVDANISTRAHKSIEVEDCAEGIIQYKNGVTAGFYAITYYSYDAPVEIELDCENGRVKMVADKGVITFKDGRELIADKNPNEVFSYGGGGKQYWGVNHHKQIKNFYESLAKGVSPDITGETVLRTQKIVCAIYESGRSGKRVEF